jgi:hypothetical protein
MPSLRTLMLLFTIVLCFSFGFSNQTPPVRAKSDAAFPRIAQPRVIGGAPADTVAVGGYAYVKISGSRCNGALIHPE